ncbi:MAG: PadR family transcriptional regulator [Candidatus Geothermincolia bacterium]
MLPAVEIPILALLAEGELHGYELNRRMREGAISRWLPASKVAIYKALTRLEAGGFLTSTSVKVGNAPERVVYTLTPPGRDRLSDLLYDLLTAEGPQASLVSLGVHFIGHLPPREAVTALDVRLDALEGALARLERERRIVDDLASPMDLLLLDHDIERHRVEVTWLQRIREEFSRNAASSLHCV